MTLHKERRVENKRFARKIILASLFRALPPPAKDGWGAEILGLSGPRAGDAIADPKLLRENIWTLCDRGVLLPDGELMYEAAKKFVLERAEKAKEAGDTFLYRDLLDLSNRIFGWDIGETHNLRNYLDERGASGFDAFLLDFCHFEQFEKVVQVVETLRSSWSTPLVLNGWLRGAYGDRIHYKPTDTVLRGRWLGAVSTSLKDRLVLEDVTLQLNTAREELGLSNLVFKPKMAVVYQSYRSTMMYILFTRLPAGHPGASKTSMKNFTSWRYIEDGKVVRKIR